MLQAIRRIIKKARYSGDDRYCPVCRTSARIFLPYGFGKKRPDAVCPFCGSMARHRFLAEFLDRREDLFANGPKKMLHVAPERCLESRFRRDVGDGYLTADLFNPRAMVKMDITGIEYPDESFDCIYCSHVLEHVPDDAKAMSEFFRVLRNDGWAILLVPVGKRAETYEDPAITDPAERLKHFGKEDHVRIYGADYPDRLRAAGFVVENFALEAFFTDAERERLGLKQRVADIYLCRKPA